MSDFDSIVLPEPTPEPEPETIETPEEAAPEPEPWYKQAGFEDEESAIKKVKGLSTWERDLQRQSTELGAKKKDPEPAIADEDDLFANLDPKEAEALKRAIRREAEAVISSTVGPKADLAEELFNQSSRKAFLAFAESAHVDPETIAGIMEDHNLWPSEPSLEALTHQMEAAAAIHRSREFDPEAERERIRAEVLKEQVKDGSSVKAVEPSKPEVTDKETDPLDETEGITPGLLDWIGKLGS